MGAREAVKGLDKVRGTGTLVKSLKATLVEGPSFNSFTILPTAASTMPLVACRINMYH